MGMIVVALILSLLDRFLLGAPIYGAYGPLSLAFVLACAVPSLAVLVRRLHDTDRTGWWALVRISSYGLVIAGGSPFQMMAALKELPLVVRIIGGGGWLIAAFAVFLFVLSEGTGGPNRYGPDPYGPDQLEEVFA